MSDSEKKARPRTNVIVFGGGITGLTAAHELSERGFQVEVIEPAEDEQASPADPAIGGMARTQWRWIHPSSVFDGHAPGAFLPTHEIVRIDQRITFERHDATIREEQEPKLAAIASLLIEHEEIERVFVEGFAFDESNVVELSSNRAKAVVAALVALGVNEARLPTAGLGDTLEDRFLATEDRRFVSFRVEADRVAGEHGYRFFPSFYYHLFDTMKRTPLMTRVRTTDVSAARVLARYERQKDLPGIQRPTEEEEGSQFVETGRTAFDNLRALPAHALAGDDRKRPVVLSRQKLISLEELREWGSTIFEDLGFSATDVAIFMGKLFKFATSCTKRRQACYSKMSWLEFIESPHYSGRFRAAMDKWPHSLVALSASECDAYTHGAISLQLILDQFRKDFTDGTLVDPTSRAWLDPWKTYLIKRHDVTFTRGKLLKFVMSDEGQLSFELRTQLKDGTTKTMVPELDGYCVVALPIEHVAAVFEDDKVLNAIARYPGLGPRNDIALAVNLSKSVQGWNVERPHGALRHFSGVQYYFEEDVDWVEGHTYYIDSPWGVSSVAQAGRWKVKYSRRKPSRAIVSVDVGIFAQPAENGRTAWNYGNREEFAREVWRQVKLGAEAQDLTLPDPAYYHVDDNLVFDSKRGIKENRSPFLVPLTGTWETRPGEPGDYRVYLDGIVLAGTYMKTHTRLTTMEAANESARHAVNAILEHRFVRSGIPQGIVCETKSMEARELPDVKLFKDIDEELFRDERPHFMDILQLDTWPVIPLYGVLRLLRRLWR